MLILLKWVIVGIVASVVGLALRFLWKYLKRQRVYLLNKYWRPVNVGLLVFVIWVLWELFWLIMIATDDGKTWLSALDKCVDPLEEWFIWSECRFNAHMDLLFPFVLAQSLLKAAVAGILVAFFLKIDSVVNRILTDAHGDTGKKKDNDDPLIKSARTAIGNTVKAVGRIATSARDSVGKIFRRRKKDNQPAPSADSPESK